MLISAIQAGDLARVQTLLASENVQPDGPYGNTPLEVALETENLDMVVALLEHGASTTHFVYNATMYPVPIAKALLDHTTLDPKTGFWLLWGTIQEKQLEHFKLILTYNLDLDFADEWGQHHLPHVACFGNLEMVRLFLEAGAHPDTFDQTAKKFATEKGFTEILNLIETYRTLPDTKGVIHPTDDV